MEGLVTDVVETQAKSLITKYKSDEHLFGTLYNANFYRGCGHGCIYCDTRSECYRMVDISKITIKTNAIDLLKKELGGRRAKGVICTGSMNDPYQPLEAQTGLVRRALEVILEYGFSVHVITKSDLVLRDIDLLSEMAKYHAVVSFSITTVDDGLARTMEPGAPPPSRRLAAMKALRGAGVHSGIAMMPFVPSITDGRESMQAVAEAAVRHGAEYAVPGCLTLRDKNREYFYNKLIAIDPQALKTIKDIYGDRYLPPEWYDKKVCGCAAELIKDAGMKLWVPRWRPDSSAPKQMTLF